MSKYKITHKKPFYASEKDETDALKQVAKALIQGANLQKKAS